MADQVLQTILTARNNSAAAFDQFVSQQKAMEAQVEKTNDAAKKSSSSFSASTAKMGAFADSVGRVSTTLARSADAFGLPTQALRTLDDVMDVAELGLGNLTKSTAGFNTATLGVVGAGLAAGVALGNYANSFKVVRDTADKATSGLANFLAKVGLFETTRDQAAGPTDHEAFTARINQIHQQAIQKQIERQKALGRSVTEIAEAYKKDLTPAVKTTAEIIEEMVEKHKKATDAEKKHQESLDQAHAMLKKRSEETARFHMEWTKKGWEVEKERIDDMKRRGAEAAAANIARFEAELEKRKESYDKMQDAMAEWAEQQEALAQAELERQEAIRQAWIDTAADIAGVVDGLAGVLTLFGVSAESSLGRAVAAMQDFAAAGQAAVQSVIQFSSGNILAGIGAGLGALSSIGKGIKGIFFGGQEEHKRVNDMRDGFVAAAGGLAELDKKAHQAGLTLERMLRAKTVQEYEAAIQQLNDAIGAQDDAINKTKAAMDEFGLSIADMGPKWAQQELDEQALSLVEKYKLLTAAGADHNLVLEKMGPSLIDYVNQSRLAGTAIPEDMRKIVEELLSQGKIIGENGVAFQNAEEAGITFGASLEQSMAKAAEQMMRLVDTIERLYGLGEINIPVNIPVRGGPVEGGGGGRAEHLAGGGVVTGWGVPAFLHGTETDPEFVFQSRQLKSLMMDVLAAGSRNGGGQPAHVSVGPTYLDGAVVARQVTMRHDMGYGRSKRRTRRR